MTRSATLMTVASVCLFSAAAFAADVPFLTGRVVDNAETLSPAARARLTSVLKAHEEATGNQVVVLTAPTIQPESVDAYAVKVFATWRLGQKGKDNGVLVLVVPQDRKLRIEVGYGLEPVLPDGACGQIIRALMTPAFKANDYDKGIEDGVAAIVARLEGRSPSMPSAPHARPIAPHATTHFTQPAMPWPVRILMGAFVFTIIGMFTVIGVMTPGSGWFLYVFLIPFWAMFPMVIIGPMPTLGVLAAYLVAFPIVKMSLRNKPWYLQAAKDLKTKGTANIGGFMTLSSGGSSISSGGFSGGGFSGGGFSGGGGSSGGGGASGSW